VSPPATWQLQPLCAAEISRLKQKLSGLGVDAVKAGIEIEFSFDDENPSNNRFQDVRAEIIRELTQQKMLLPRSARAEIDDRIVQVEAFTAREVMMYDVIERDPRTKDILEPLFGAHGGPGGYYDGENCLELKLAYTDVHDALINYRKVVEVLNEKGAEYGIAWSAYPTCHISFSFWNGEGNVLLSGNSDFHTLGASAVEGITRGLYDLLPVLFLPDGIRKIAEGTPMNVDDLLANFSRASHIRVSNGRLEVRPEAQHLELIAVAALAGAVYAMQGDADDIKFAEIAMTPNIDYSKPNNKLICHLLSNAEYLPDGRLWMSQEYLDRNIEELGHALGLREKVHPLESLFRISSGFNPFLNDFFAAIRLQETDGAYNIIWPETALGVFSFTTPDVGFEKIPPHLQRRIRDGERAKDIEEVRDIVGLFGTPPQLGETYTIDVAALGQDVTCRGVDTRYILRDGYPINADEYSTGWDYAKTIESRVLDTVCSDGFAQGFRTFMKDCFGVGAVPEPLPDLDDIEITRRRIPLGFVGSGK
jgi:hypothetical protein